MGAVYSPGEDAVQRPVSPQFSVTETTIPSLSATITCNATDANAQGAWALVEYTVPPRSSVRRPPWHDRTLEGCYVLAGTLTLHVDDQRVTASAGSFMVMLPGTVDRLTNESDVPATLLTVVAPAGFDRYADTFAQAVAARSGSGALDVNA